jgi:hypothetical protein
MRTQPVTVPIWGSDITVTQEGGGFLVKGRRMLSSVQKGIGLELDILGQSRPLARWGQQRRKMPPHVVFANAITDAKMIDFMRKWGPIHGYPTVTISDGLQVVSDTSKSHLYMIATPPVVLEVKQTLAQLRSEQKIFSGAARLIAEIQSKRPDAQRVFDHYSRLPESFERDFFFNVVESTRHGRSSSDVACYQAEVALCNLLDRFPAQITPTRWGPVELPPLDKKRACGQGIRQVLYFLLRLEYLRKDRVGLGICPLCDEVFAKERRGADFCSADCSHRSRNLEYYHASGFEMRRAKRLKENPRVYKK